MARLWKDLHDGRISDEAFKAMGVANLTGIIASLRDQEQSSSTQVRALAEKAAAFTNQATDLDDQADYAIDPLNLMPGIADATALEDIPPLTFDTTFRMCGKCTHGTEYGARKYGNSEIACSLLERLGDEKRLSYNSSCVVRKLPKDRLKAIVRTFDKNCEDAKAKRMTTRVLLGRLMQLKQTASEMPLFPEFRDSYHFLYGDRVVLYVYYATISKRYRWQWVQGVVLPPSLNGGHYVTVRLDAPLIKPRWPSDAESESYKTCQAFIIRDINAQSPFLMHLADFEKIASLAPGHLFRTRWLSEVSEDGTLQCDDMRGKRVDINMAQYAERLSKRYLVGEDAVQQLMHVDAALTILGLTIDDLSPSGIVARYRELREARRGAVGNDIDRAKDTLLIRLKGLSFKKK